jgi:hypothetical protein
MNILPFDLSQKNLWQEAQYKEMLLAGLAREGITEQTLGELKDLLESVKPSSYPELRGHIGAFPELTRKLDELYSENHNTYLTHSPEETRVVQWPNSQRIKREQPEHYFDIFEDVFYRKAIPFITKQMPIGSFGSCFALRLAHKLQLWGFNYVIEEDDLPKDFPLSQLESTYYRMAPARVGTLLNIGAIRQTIQRAFGLWHPEALVVKTETGFQDPFRYIDASYKSLDAFFEDYETHTAALKRALLKCEVVVLTLGLTETWQLAHSGDFLSMDPQKIDPLLVKQKNLTLEENLKELELIYETYKKFVPNIKFILSVSPVGLNKTYSKKNHVVVSTCYSKSVLRVAAEEFSNRHPGEAFYFPSYEMVMYGVRNPWEADRRHVSNEAVTRVMQMFSKMFLKEE